MRGVRVNGEPQVISCDRCTAVIDGGSFGGVSVGFYDVRPEKGNPWSFLGKENEADVCNECAHSSDAYRGWSLRNTPWVRM